MIIDNPYSFFKISGESIDKPSINLLEDMDDDDEKQLGSSINLLDMDSDECVGRILLIFSSSDEVDHGIGISDVVDVNDVEVIKDTLMTMTIKANKEKRRADGLEVKLVNANKKLAEAKEKIKKLKRKEEEDAAEMNTALEDIKARFIKMQKRAKKAEAENRVLSSEIRELKVSGVGPDWKNIKDKTAEAKEAFERTTDNAKESLEQLIKSTKDLQKISRILDNLERVAEVNS